MPHDSIYGAMAALAPETSFQDLEMIVGLSQAALISELGATINPKDFAKTVIGSDTIIARLEDCATDSMFECVTEIKNDGSKVFLMCDKGAKKGAVTHFVKLISWYSKKDKQVKTFNLDSDDA
jgi:hypothetical protein